MKTLLKNCIASGINFIGFPKFRLRQYRDKVLILTYHGVLPKTEIEYDVNFYAYRNVVTLEQFIKEIQFLKENFYLTSLLELENNSRPLSTKPKAIITFDDGFRNNYKYAYPILAENAISGHFFVTTGYIGKKKMLWTDQITYQLLNTHKRECYFPKLIPEKLNLCSDHDRIRASIKLREAIKKLPFQDAYNIASELTAYFDDVNLEEANPERYHFMDWKEIKEMYNNNMIIGSHTHNHALLNINDEKFYRTELGLSIECLKNNADINCRYLAYPNGTPNDYCRELFPVLNELGFRYALTQISEWNTFQQIQKNPYELFRINIPYLPGIDMFKLYITKIVN